jgi:hypothetical protein
MLPATGILIALLFSACDMDDRDDAMFSEMGVTVPVRTVEAAADAIEIEVYSNHECTVYPAEDYEWLTLLTDRVSGDGSFTVAFSENTGFRRMAKIYVAVPENSRLDSVILRQQGQMSVVMTSGSPNTKVLSAGGMVAIPFVTNLDVDKIDVSLFDEAGFSWIEPDFAIDRQAGSLNVTVGRNTSDDELRNARFVLRHTDAWDSIFFYSLYLTQANARDEFGSLISFPQARNWAGDKVSSYEYIEGYIISDAGNMNMGDNPQTTLVNIEYTVNDRTAYIQSVDGQYGFMIQTKTADDNVFTRYSRVQLLLTDADMVREDNPARYIIRNVTSSMILSSETGTYAALPAKEKRMSQLTDDDIYTYVTLKDCEFPVRKGSFTPYNEGYTILYNANRVNKYPLLMRDIEGESMYLYTNTTCPYRRDGRMLPYGSGEISGILVHETFPRFEYEDTGNEDTYGEIGRYQLRHVTREDIRFAESFDNSFSACLTEYRYPNIVNGIQTPTDGHVNGSISISQTMTNPGATIGRTSDFSYLGPCGYPDHVGNTNPLGNGILLPDGTKQNKEAGTNNDAGTNGGKGITVNAAWAHSGIWWNYAENRGEAYIIDFSTQGITTDRLSMQFAMQGTGGFGCPRFWDVEWSEDGKWYTSDNPADPGRAWIPWKKIGSFTLPEIVNWSVTLLHQLPGHKYYDFPLPLEMLGKSKVYIRLIVSENSCGTGAIGANNYQGEKISSVTNKNVAMGYFAIRYNK